MPPLSESDVSVQALLKAIQADDNTGLAEALVEISNTGTTREVALKLASRLKPLYDAEVRKASIIGLTRLGDSALEAVPALGNALNNDSDWNVRRLALSGLEMLDPVAGIPYFQQSISDPELGELALTSIGIALHRVVARSEQLEGPERQQLEAAFYLIDSETLTTLINRPVSVEGAAVSAAAVIALVTAYPTEAVEPLCDFLQTWLRQQEEAEEGKNSLLVDLGEYEAGRQRTAVTIIKRLGSLGNARAIVCLIETLEKNLHVETREWAAKSLALYSENDAAI